MTVKYARVMVPEGITPGDLFTINFNGQLFEVQCPPHSGHGEWIDVAVPILARHKDNLRIETQGSALGTMYPQISVGGTAAVATGIIVSNPSERVARANDEYNSLTEFSPAPTDCNILSQKGLRLFQTAVQGSPLHPTSRRNFVDDHEPVNVVLDPMSLSAGYQHRPPLVEAAQHGLNLGHEQESAENGLNLGHEQESPGTSYNDGCDYLGLALPPHPSGMMDHCKTKTLEEGSSGVLDSSVKSIKVGLSWEAECDLDGSLVLFDSRYKAVDVVSHSQLYSSKVPGVKYTPGDYTTTDKDVLKIKLRMLPSSVVYIGVVACVRDARFKDLSAVKSLGVRILHGSKKVSMSGKVLCKYNVSKRRLQGTSLLCCVLVRTGAWWSVHNVGIGAAQVYSAHQLVSRQAPLVGRLLRLLPWSKPEYRIVTITVPCASGLSERFTGDACDPFVTLNFRRQQVKSKPVSRSLNPKWSNAAGLVIHGVDAAELKPIKIEIWDHDKSTVSELLGLIKIPVATLFNLGIGRHERWLPLQHDMHRKTNRCQGQVKIVVSVGQQ